MELTPKNDENLFGTPNKDIQLPDPEKPLIDPAHYNSICIDGEWYQL